MIFIKALILGVVQGITEFLPVSSSGHLAVFRQLLGFQADNSLSFDIWLHAGSLLAVVLTFRKEIGKSLTAGGRMLRDTGVNTASFLKSAGTHSGPYRKILTGNYRYMNAMLLIACVPTAILGILLRGVAAAAAKTLLIPGMGMFITAVVLIVVDKVENKTAVPREVSPVKALIIGTAQGIAVIPGISRLGMTLTTSLLCGMNRRSALRFSCFLSIPAIIGSLICESLMTGGTAGLTGEMILAGLIGMTAAAVTGYAVIRRMLQLIGRIRLSHFAVYSFVMGMIAMAGHFLQ